MKIVKEKNIKTNEVVEVLKKGGLVIYPTETLYGIGADATNEKAIKKLNKFKKRPVDKPYSIAVSDISMANKYVRLNKSARNIYETFLPGPVTVISRGKHKVAKGVESENGTLGIRISSYLLVQNIVKQFGGPITATSANASYKKRPYKISDILENISESQKKYISLIVDAGELPHNEPSTVVDTTYEDIAVLRQGNIILKNENEILSRSENDTQNCAKELWQKYESYFGKRAIVFALIGEMGAGKTMFTKGLAKVIGISDLITSPTYNLINTYTTPDGLKKLTHIDVWRISDIEGLIDLNIAKEISDKSILSIEWSEKFTDEIKKFNDEAIIVWIKINFTKKENERLISWGVSK